jgi:hypothetical protein
MWQMPHLSTLYDKAVCGGSQIRQTLTRDQGSCVIQVAMLRTPWEMLEGLHFLAIHRHSYSPETSGHLVKCALVGCVAGFAGI